MIKITRIITRLNIGGPAIHTVLLSSALNKDGYRDILVCGTVSDSEGDMGFLAEERNVRPIIIPELKREISFVNDLRAFLKLWSIIRKEKPDIVHTHTAKAGFLGRLAAIFSGVPVKIHTLHGHIFDGYFSPYKAKLFGSIEKFLAIFTDKVIVVSDRVKDDIVIRLKIASESKCVVVPLGLELDEFLGCESTKGSFRKEFGITYDTILVGIVGRLVPIKNHKMFLDAARNILDRHLPVNIRFVIIGDGELNEELKKYADKLGLNDSVIFTGWRRRLSNVYADLDIVALTSLNEGTPVSVIEAMASGKAVIATDVGGVRDLIADGENGILVKSGEMENFSDKLSTLMVDNEKRSKLGSCGRSFVRGRHTKEILVKNIKDLYEKCLNEKGIKT